jgi:hypothetical protein
MIPIALAAAVLPQACVTEGKAPPPQPRPLPEQPRGIFADRLVRTVGIPEDTDRNGLSDLIPVTVYLFNDQYVAPLALPGRFTFRLTDASGEQELARWEYDQAAAERARRNFMVGPGYTFRLSLLDVRPAVPGAGPPERLPTREPLLFITFTPAEGPPVDPRTGTTVFLGGR